MSKYFLIPILFAFFSCNDQNGTFDIGSKYVDVQTNLQYVDTMTVKSYTVRIDSIHTSGLQAGSIVAGKYHDPSIGDVSSTSYFNMGLPAYRTIPHNAVYDSIRLILVGTSYSMGDTMVPVTFEVHRLTENMKAGDDGHFYNTSSLSYDPAIFGSVQYAPRPHQVDTLNIGLENSFGQELFNMLLNKDDRVSNMDNFLGYFKGLVLKGGEDDDAILGFSISDGFPRIRVYFHYSDFTTINKFADFSIYNTALQFNHFEITNPVEPFPTRQSEKLSSTQTGNMSFLQGGTGILTRLEIPYLRNLLALHTNIQILRADLIIEPARNTYKTFPLPQKLNLYVSDRLNRFGSLLRNSLTGDVETGTLVIDKLYQEETKYTFDITPFIDTKMFEQSDEVPALLISIISDDFNRIPDRLVLGSQSNPYNKIKLKIYYMNYE